MTDLDAGHVTICLATLQHCHKLLLYLTAAILETTRSGTQQPLSTLFTRSYNGHVNIVASSRAPSNYRLL